MDHYISTGYIPRHIPHIFTKCFTNMTIQGVPHSSPNTFKKILNGINKLNSCSRVGYSKNNVMNQILNTIWITKWLVTSCNVCARANGCQNVLYIQLTCCSPIRIVICLSTRPDDLSHEDVISVSRIHSLLCQILW